jgi:peptidylprolyl isomerase
MLRLRQSALVTVLVATLALANHDAHAQAGKPNEPAKAKSMQDILDASKATDWRQLNPKNTLYLELANGRVII